MLHYLYPGGRKKACTFSYDDNQEYDRRLVEIFNRYELKATFHINAGTLDREGFVRTDETGKLYAGHEVSCHGYSHPFMTHLSETELSFEIMEERKILEKITGYPIRGLSYPFGDYSEGVIKVLSGLGMEYGRTVDESDSFGVPGDWMKWKPTCHHNRLSEELIERFENQPEYSRLPLLYVWGHSFEFEREKSWVFFEKMCDRLRQCSEVWFATNIEIKEYLTAVRGLVCSADCRTIYNPSAKTIFVNLEDQVKTIQPGEIVSIP